MGYKSFADMFRGRVQKTPEREAFSYRRGETWISMSWKQVNEEVRAIAGGLRALGQDDEERVGILSNTRIEWLLTDLAIMCSGGATTTVYPSSTADDSAYILNDSGSVVCIVEDDGQVKKLLSVRDQLPHLKHLVVIDGTAGHDGWVITFDDLKKKGAEWLKDNNLDEVIDRITPDKLATLIYTSGTTGKPKGVELLHDCWLYEGEAIDSANILSENDKQFLWLPLSHSFGKVLETIAVHIGVPTAIDGEIPRIVDNLAVVQPTFMGAAPRIFEKAYNKIVNTTREAGGMKWKIFQWAFSVGKEVSKLQQAGKQPSGLLAMKHSIADKLVFSKIRARFGGRIRFFISGSAPLNREIAEFFHAAGLLILEGYGLTESSAASFVNVPDLNAFGTVGRPVPGTEVKIDPDTGEILIRGRGIMRGYYNLPDVSAETVDKDGWLHTGDKGELDDQGRLRITDRIKDLIKTSGGKYVAPAAIEGAFKAICPLVSQVVVHGNNRNFCTALVTVDPDAAKGWAEGRGLGNASYADIAKHPDLRAEFKAAFDELNKTLARYETIKDFAILPADLTIEAGELTPSLKVKRKVVEQKYKDLLDGFYKGSLADV